MTYSKLFTFILCATTALNAAASGHGNSKKRRIGAEVGAVTSGSEGKVGVLRGVLTDVKPYHGPFVDAGNRDVGGFDFNPGGEFSVQMDKDKNVRNYWLKADVVTLRRLTSGLSFAEPEDRSVGHLSDSATPEDLSRLYYLGNLLRQQETFIRNAPLKEKQDFADLREKYIKLQMNILPPHLKEKEMGIRDGYKEILKAEAIDPLNGLVEEERKQNARAQDQCSSTENDEKTTKECYQKLKAIRQEVDANLEAISRKKRMYLQRKEEIEMEISEEVKNQIPEIRQYLAEKNSPLARLKEKERKEIAVLKKEHAQRLKDYKRKSRQLVSELKSLAGKFQEGSPLANYRTYVDDPNIVDLYTGNAPTAYVSTGLGVIGIRANRNQAIGSEQKYLRLSAVELAYYSAKSPPGGFGYCFEFSPLALAVGNLQPSVKINSGEPKIGQAYSFEGKLCLEKSLGHKVGKIRNELTGQLLFGIEDDPTISGGQGKQQLFMARVSNRLQVKDILGTPVSASWEVILDRDSSNVLFGEPENDGTNLQESKKNVQHQITVGAEF